MTTCDTCGAEYTIGDWPYCPHGVPTAYHPFKPYFDIGLGKEITSQAERWSTMRKQGVQYSGSKMGTKGCEV